MTKPNNETFQSCGFILMNKPTGLTSFRLLGPLKKTFKPAKTGHAGTLDQDARGLMIVAIGKASRLLQYLEVQDKTYEFTFHVGRTTASAEYYHEDIIEEDLSQSFQMNDLKRVLNQFKGEISQTPPMYSAVKINGKRASDRVRAGEEIQLKSRQVYIHDLDIIDSMAQETYQSIRLKVKCSKGTYVRSLCVDIAKELGLWGSASDIYRIQIGDYSIEDAISLDDFKNQVGFPEQDPTEDRPKLSQEDLNLDQANKFLIEPHHFLSHWPTMAVSSKTAFYLKRGMRQKVDQSEREEGSQVFILDNLGKLLCLSEIKDSEIAPKIMFQV